MINANMGYMNGACLQFNHSKWSSEVKIVLGKLACEMGILTFKNNFEWIMSGLFLLPMPFGFLIKFC